MNTASAFRSISVCALLISVLFGSYGCAKEEPAAVEEEAADVTAGSRPQPGMIAELNPEAEKPRAPLDLPVSGPGKLDLPAPGDDFEFRGSVC